VIILTNDVTRMHPEDVWQIYMSIKLHFETSSKLDAFKYDFRGPRLKIGSSNELKNKWTLEKLSKKYSKKNELILYFLANILDGKDWIGDTCDESYQVFLAKIQRLDYTFKSDMNKLLDMCSEKGFSFDDAFTSKDRSDFPLIYSLYKREDISLETLVILDTLIGFTKDINKNIADPLGIINDISYKIMQYKPFLKSEMLLEKYRELIIKLFTPVDNYVIISK